jgi:hypothetical protein
MAVARTVPLQALMGSLIEPSNDVVAFTIVGWLNGCGNATPARRNAVKKLLQKNFHGGKKLCGGRRVAVISEVARKFWGVGGGLRRFRSRSLGAAATRRAAGDGGTAAVAVMQRLFAADLIEAHRHPHGVVQIAAEATHSRPSHAYRPRALARPLSAR